jgi:hypothetical protein
MNRTTTVVVALIAAAGLSTMVYAVPEQRALAHLRLHLLSHYPPNLTPDAFPFGPNSPDPPLSASKSDPRGPPFGPNCVGCISTQNLANGAVTNPKIANNSVNSTQLQAGVLGPKITLYSIPDGQDGWFPGAGGWTQGNPGPWASNTKQFTIHCCSGIANGLPLSAVQLDSTIVVSVTGGQTSPMICTVFANFVSSGNTGFDMQCIGPPTGDTGASLQVAVINP